MQVKDRSQHLNCITKELIDSGRHLQEITNKKVDCLRAFVNHKKFADWLKKSLRGRTRSFMFINIMLCHSLTFMPFWWHSFAGKSYNEDHDTNAI